MTRYEQLRRLVQPAYLTALVAILLGNVVAVPARAEPPRPWISQPAGPVRKVAVFGSDDRVPLPRDRQLQGKIGLLFSPKARTLCTAFCVADDVIATAAHCLFRTAGDAYPALEDFRFGPSKDQPRSQVRLAGFASRSSLQNVASGSISLSVRPPIDAAHDWALARLSSPVCRGNVLKLAPMPEKTMQSAAAAGQLWMMGYHRDFSDWRPALSRDCEVKSLSDLITPTRPLGAANP